MHADGLADGDGLPLGVVDDAVKVLDVAEAVAVRGYVRDGEGGVYVLAGQWQVAGMRLL